MNELFIAQNHERNPTVIFNAINGRQASTYVRDYEILLFLDINVFRAVM
jgi:hypothetical protein